MSPQEGVDLRFRGLGFSDAEARVYLELLRKGEANGSRLAAACGLARTTAYAALESLLRRGAVLQTLGEPRTFRARAPSVLFSEIGRRASEDAEALAAALAPLEGGAKSSEVWNIPDEASLLSKAASLIAGARKEILLNTDWYTQTLMPDLAAATARSVMVQHFAFCGGPELPGGSTWRKSVPAPHARPREGARHRLMLVADMGAAICASREPSGEVFGIFTEDRLLVHVVAEHIHHDIYLARLAQAQGRDIVDASVKLGTMLEGERR